MSKNMKDVQQCASRFFVILSNELSVIRPQVLVSTVFAVQSNFFGVADIIQNYIAMNTYYADQRIYLMNKIIKL